MHLLRFLPGFSDSRRLSAAAFALAALSVLGSCIGGTTSGTKTGSRISIRGRVVDGDQEPVAGLVARLSLSGLADTTDSQGQFHILGEEGPAIAKAGVLDTLVVSQDDQRIASLGITKWVDSLPDIKVVQRSFSGRIDAEGIEVGKVEGVLSGSGLPEGNRVVAEFFYNKPVREYSGFIYFPSSGKEAAYTIYVDVYDTAGFITGRSDTIAFNGLAGDVTLPEFSASNIRLSAHAGVDTVVPPGSKVLLAGRAFTPPGAEVSEFAWKIGDAPDFLAGTDGRVEFTAPPAMDTAFSAVLRVRNEAGATAFDTVRIRTADLFDSILVQPWRLATAQPGFPPLEWSTAVVFMDRIRLMGIGDGKFHSWESRDGQKWQGGPCTGVCPDGQVTIAAKGEKLWAMAEPYPGESFNRIWTSGDGVEWFLLSDPPSFGERSQMRMVAFLDRLWMLGGMKAGESIDEVWSSADGTHWERAASMAGFGFLHSAYVQGGRIWVVGQVMDSIASGVRLELWSTPDGKKWERAGMSGEIPRGYEAFSAVEFRGRALYLGGAYLDSRNAVTAQREAIYIERDHCCLKKIVASNSPPARLYGSAVAYKGTVYLLGGSGFEEEANDVWYWGME